VLLYYFSEDFEFRRDTDFTTENLTGMYFIEYGLSAGEENGINNPAFMRELDGFARWFREQEEVLHVNVVTDVVKRVNKAMNDDEWRSYVIPDDPDSVAQLLLVYEMSLPYGLDLNDQVDVQRSGVRMTVTTRTLSSAELIQLEERAHGWLVRHSSQMDATLPTGGFTLFSHVAEQNIRSMLLATAIALVLISDLLILALSSVPFGLLSLVPNFLPIAMGFGVWGVTVGEIGLSLSIVSSMTLGIVVDDTVHMLSKYLRARRELGLTSRDAVLYAYETVGGALVITSAVLVLGFLVLATSDFNLNATMGMLTAMIIALALFVDLFFLPPLLVLLDKITHLVDEDDDDDPHATMKRVAK
ncbi:MAG: MMPL family transporter, partial [Gammaproteobacteria bacterium]|nr:MMPL family transporter [Gammaproteobacteria bacterium]